MNIKFITILIIISFSPLLSAQSAAEKKVINQFLEGAPQQVHTSLKKELSQGVLGYFEPCFLETRDFSDDEKEFLKSKLNEIHKLPLTHICLLDMQLTEVPLGLFEMPQLTEVVLTSNYISTLPELTSSLSRLQVLCINDNKLRHIPEYIGKLACLRYLDLENNELTTLPESLALHCLMCREIWAKGNDISLSHLPERLCIAHEKTKKWKRGEQILSKPIFVYQVSEHELTDNRTTIVPEIRICKWVICLPMSKPITTLHLIDD